MCAFKMHVPTLYKWLNPYFKEKFLLNLIENEMVFSPTISGLQRGSLRIQISLNSLLRSFSIWNRFVGLHMIFWFACLFTWHKISLCSPSYPGACYVEQAGIKLKRSTCLWILRGKRLETLKGKLFKSEECGADC